MLTLSRQRIGIDVLVRHRLGGVVDRGWVRPRRAVIQHGLDTFIFVEIRDWSELVVGASLTLRVVLMLLPAKRNVETSAVKRSR